MRDFFGNINPVPQAKGLVDICLSKTNRQTPTVIHKQYEITRIRNFYIRKVKHCTDEFIGRLNRILGDFPILEDIHPFYTELITILYDKDTYKIALGKLNSTKSKLQAIQNNSLKMIKFADSMYRCKCLKRAALGQMATTVTKLKGELEYLENVRQHLTRLPIINPLGRTVIVAGFPNVGKSSFLQKVSKCKTEVQPYAFTTKSLFVGHVEYNDLTYQFIDTPGILDHPLEERNKVEMLSISAMAHLKSVVCYFIDVSESCGHTIEEQINLFRSLQPLLNSQFLIVLSKTDLLAAKATGENVDVSTMIPDNLKEFLNDKKHLFISHVDASSFTASKTACEMLLEERLIEKEEKKAGFLHRIKVTESAVHHTPYENNHLGTNEFIGIESEREAYLIPEKDDMIPEIMNGKNICDFMNSVNGGGDVNSHNTLMELLSTIELPVLRNYDTLTPEELELYERINGCRMAANMKSIFSKRGFIKKGHVLEEGIEGNDEYVKPNAGTHVHNKKITRDKVNIDSNPKHLIRKTSNKHAKTR